MRILTSSELALKAAAEVIAERARELSGMFSQRIPAAIKVYRGGGPGQVFVSAGSRGGKWGWEPIHAWMFEEPHTGKVPKHPLFGNRKLWYYQPYRPYMEIAAESAGGDAVELYAALEIARWAKESGYK
jgi:hypothetical protein